MIALVKEYERRFAALPTVQLVEFRDEPWRRIELNRVGAARRAAILFSFLGADRISEDIGEAPAATFRFAAACVADAKSGKREGVSRGSHATLLAQRVAHLLTTGPLFPETTRSLGRPTAGRIRNVSDDKTAELGVAVATVEWTHRVEIDALAIDATLNDYRGTTANFDIDGDGQPEATARTEHP